ncbi:uncharacterized protein LACBIDRAFT_305196 [Laccaria bicolor S238N-H82]|uniref:Predicted protein n=1 Tax=Laccaria bicolor (strain S238N-H82 / ATCC MYA-4686) TaxID=486041 RepID=B0CTN0_LACBS|nr:uncharacterized protein LACBIDRAFT_305196 [Laccaria bicolor S238N-H82]EDR14522.1 predicted protein [Laccaria bicolor S238N-H82]|eukprot:XP_001875081.1 predicted protein [Laccaria bicolor S238N-H82]
MLKVNTNEVILEWFDMKIFTSNSLALDHVVSGRLCLGSTQAIVQSSDVDNLTLRWTAQEPRWCQNESRREHPVLWNPSVLTVATLPKDQLSDIAARPPLFRSLLISSAIRARTLISNTVPADREVLDP